MKPFREKIRNAIADESLQKALDANAERRVSGRVAAFASLPDWRERRQKAHAVRAEVIEHLDEILAQFISRVQANGFTVHRATDAAEAVRLVLEIAETAEHAKSNPPGLLFAKSKSMVSEEIGLNHALEAAGQRVVETDLGEYIIQLRGERPAHIITPAVHLRRHQVGELFHEKLGIPYTEDIPSLTSTARAVLREVFLTADIGLSGVNFGVAETGTLAIVTNEGNGRMCTSLPPVHIALMGMERLLPTLDDLALFLSLLPRSATGQKLSVYTQLIHGAEDASTRLGGKPQQKHLVIVDNGRSKLRSSPLKESLYCIRCGACLNACPVFREIGGHGYLGVDGSIAPYPGPIGSVISPGLLGTDFTQLAQASTLCGACKDACPVDIDLPKLLLRVRAGEIPAGSDSKKAADSYAGQDLPGALKFGLGAYSRLSGHPILFAVLQKLAGWFSLPLPAYLPLPAATGWGFSRHLPKPAARPFRERWREMKNPPESGALPEKQTEGLAAHPEPPAAQSASSLVSIFSAELSAVGGQVHSVRQADLPGALAGFLRERGMTSVMMWENLPILLHSTLVKEGLRVEILPAADLEVGISGALAGIADTGTLVIPAGPGQPLSVSLLPGIHIAILRAADLLPSLEQALRLPEVSSAPATVLVTGPSRTADIEMTLTIGVHGPGELHVFLVDASAGQ